MGRITFTRLSVQVVIAVAIFLAVGALDEAKGKSPLARRVIDWVSYALTQRTDVREAYANTRSWVSSRAATLWPDLETFSSARELAPPGPPADSRATGDSGSAALQRAPGAGAGMLTPCEGVVTRTFGVSAHPVLRIPLPHYGVDIAASTGTPVRAATDGRVVEARPKGTYGRTVVLSHAGGLTTSYSHLSRIDVTVGQEVAAGDTIGLVGMTGLATGPHLHFEVRRGGVACDPADLLPRLSPSAAPAGTATGPSNIHGLVAPHNTG